jgi:hypothetical protein
MNLFFEALVVGLMLSFIGTIIAFIFRFTSKEQYQLGKWLINTLLMFFITGFLTHLILEFTGINKRYCQTGSACK